MAKYLFNSLKLPIRQSITAMFACEGDAPLGYQKGKKDITNPSARSLLMTKSRDW